MIERACAWKPCGKLFVRRGRQVYCQPRCSELEHERRRAAKRPRLKIQVDAFGWRTCARPGCYERLPDDAPAYQRYHNKRCRMQYYTRRIWYPRYPKQPDVWVPRTCFCGTPFKVHLKSRRKKEYCSLACRQKMARVRRILRETQQLQGDGHGHDSSARA